jgi:hypothetical protein
MAGHLRLALFLSLGQMERATPVIAGRLSVGRRADSSGDWGNTGLRQAQTYYLSDSKTP